MSLAPQIISASPGTPQGTVQALADIQRTINALTAEAGNLHPRSISADRIKVNAITATEIAANTITAGQIQAGTITATEIATDAITATKIQAGAVTGAGTSGTGEIASATITGFNIEAGTVNADRITAGTITADRLVATNLGAIFANLGTVTSGTLSVGAGACVISDASGITIAQGTTGVHNITWLTGTSTIGTVISSNTVSGSSNFSIQGYSPNQANNARINLSGTNGSSQVVIGAGTINSENTYLSLMDTGIISCSHGIGFYGGTAPLTRPAHPVTLADVIAIIVGYNMSA